MADSFAGGLAQGLDSLLPSIRAERERKAQDKFKLDLYNDEKNTNNEIRRLATKQRALEIFGQGIREIQQQKTKMTLDMLVNRHSKGSQNLALTVREMDDQLKATDADIKSLRSKMYEYYNQTNRDNEKDSSSGKLNLLEDGGKPTEKQKINFLETDLYKGMKAELDTLEANKKALIDSKKANLAKLSSGSDALNQQAEQISKAFTIDDALASREGEVLKESLGLTDDDVARFKIRKGNAGALDAYVNDNTQPDYSPVTFEPDYKGMGIDSTQSQESNILNNPAKRAILKEKVFNAVNNLPNDITSLKVLSNQDFNDARQDPEIRGILEQGLVSVKNIGGTVKQKILGGTATDPEIRTLDNIAKLGASLSPEQLQKIRSSNGDDGATNTVQLLGDVLTPDTFSGLSKLNEQSNIEESKLQRYLQAQKDEANTGITPIVTAFGTINKPTPPLKWTEDEYQKVIRGLDNSKKKTKSLNDLILNYNDFKNTLVDPSKQYQYRPVDFSYLDNK